MASSQSGSHPTLILVRGLPGSGKSYLARALGESIGDEAVVLVDPDAIDQAGSEYRDFSKALLADGVDAKLHPYRFLRAKAYQAITDHKVIIWNQAFTNLDGFNKTVVNLQGYAAEHSTSLPLLVVEVEVDETTARDRVAERAGQGGNNVSEEAFVRFIAEYKTFVDEGFNTVVVNGKDDVTISVKAVLKAFHRLSA